MKARTSNRKSAPTSAPRAGEVYFEFITVGHAVKVSAIDAATGMEVAISGPATASVEELKRIALRKLQNKLTSKA